MTKNLKILISILLPIFILSVGYTVFLFKGPKDSQQTYNISTENHDEEDEHNDEDEHEEDGEDVRIILNKQDRDEQGLSNMTVSLKILDKEVVVPGEVTLDLYNSSLVTPRISAQVIERHVLLGDFVTKGSPLVSLSSVEMANAQGNLIITDQEWKRVSQLGSDVVSGRRYIEAQVAAQQGKARVKAYGMTDDQISNLLSEGDISKATGTFTLNAEQDGTIVSENLILGEFVEAGHQIFTISDENKAWVNASLEADQGAHIEIGSKAKVNVDESHIFEGSLIQVHHSLDEETRTLPVRIAVTNEGDEMHPGQFVEVAIVVDKTQPILAVPRDAVILLKGAPTVFILEGDEVLPQSISTGDTYNEWIEITNGLSVGDNIIVGNLFYIKSLILKSEMGEGHGH